MKTKFSNTIFKLGLMMLVSLLFSVGVFAQAVPPVPQLPSVNKIKPVSENLDSKNQGPIKTITKRLELTNRSQFYLQFNDVDVSVLPTKENQVVLEVNYRLSTSDTAVETRIQRAMQQNMLTRSENQVKISSGFYKNYWSQVSFWGMRRNEMELMDGSKISFESFDLIAIKLYLPADADVVLNMKYGKINFEHSIAGNFDVEAYDTQIKAKSIRGNTKVNAKYSKLTFDTMGALNLEAYETSMDAAAVQELDMNIKYSKIRVKQLGNVVYKGYEDRISFIKLKQLKADTKYSEIELDDCPVVKAVMYEGSLEVQQGNSVVLDGKYVDMEFGNLNTFKLNNGYENDINFTAVDSIISANGKYNEFEINRLNKVLKLDGYEDEIRIGLLGKSFSGLSISGKYVDVELATESGISYQLTGNIQYPEFNVDKNDYKLVVHDKDSDKMVFDYRFGKDLNNLPAIRIVGYEMHVTIDNK